MIEVSRKTLELFIEKAEHLKYLAVSTNNFGGLIGIVRDSDQQRWRFHPELEGPLLTFRMFLQENERIGLYSRNSQGKRQRPKLLDLPGASDAWREKVEQAYNWIDKLLDAELPNLLYNGQPIHAGKCSKPFSMVTLLTLLPISVKLTSSGGRIKNYLETLSMNLWVRFNSCLVRYYRLQK